ncbi:MAG TPA: TonB-dependent receptor [Cyclobacteriaceae bacterium]|nr:TonB-dependent receptor [Cyclobacteriaceae bacterium]
MRRILLMAAFVITACCGAMAQGVTTSTLSGTIKDSNGGAVPGANIVATHTPSGTTYGTMSAADGKYSMPNLRTGGPYTVKISFVGYGEQTFGDIYLRLGETYVQNATLSEQATELGEIVISSAEDKVMNSNRNGAVTNVSTREIMNMPTITRSMNDLTRFTPQATSNSNGAIGGGNYRQNYITVDGSSFNNTFGIGGNLPANGSPISLDALEEISVNITPYDIRQANFIGSAMNAITRSGTNEFSGSAYTFWRNENQQGDEVGDNPKITPQPLDIKTFGFRLGGPILKNKLFFFVNYEQTNETRPGQLQVAATPARPFDPTNDPGVSRPLASDLDMMSQYLKDTYGYNTGPYQGYDNETNSNKFTARLDWNINSNHRINVRYSQVESKSPSFPSTSTSGSGFTPANGYNRQSNNAMFFKNAGYFQEANYYSLAVEANSLFGKIANTFRATYTHQNDPRSSGGSTFPFVDILDGDVANNRTYTTFGYELFTYGNLRDVTTYSIVDFATLTKGIHTITAGIQADFEKTKNGFQRFGTGYYVFSDWDDFINGANPINYAITFSLSPGYKQAFPNIAYNQYSVYGQDEISINDKFKLTAGVRFDLPTFPETDGIITHPLVEPLTFNNGEKMDSGVLPKTRVMVSPRIGFNWDVKGDRSLQVRGGTGIFTGRVPTVWLVAQSGDAGMLQFTQTYTGIANTPGPFNPDPRAYLPGTPPAAGTAIPTTFSAIDPDFKFPQAWKTSIAVDKKLPLGLIGTLEGIFTKDLNTAIGYNPNIVDPTPLGVTDYPDNRPFYPTANINKFVNKLNNAGQASATNTNAWNPIILSNGNKGYYWSLTAKVEKQFEKGFAAFIAYTHSDAKVLYDGSGDQLINTWQNTQISTSTANDPELSTANYIAPDRVIASVSYRKEYLKKLATQISLFWEGSIAGRYSYTYSSDFNRDGQVNDLIYIPRDASEITFTAFDYDGAAGPNPAVTAQEQSDLFFAYIEQDDYLSKHKGEYAERNGAKMPWRNQIDVRLTQDLFTNIGGKKNTLQFTLDIFNFGNMLNSDWGIFKQVNAPGILVPTNITSTGGAVIVGGAVTPTFRLQSNGSAPVTTTYRDNNTITSTYYMQFGLRYIFN